MAATITPLFFLSGSDHRTPVLTRLPIDIEVEIGPAETSITKTPPERLRRVPEA
jgi:hypothetical protein